MGSARSSAGGCSGRGHGPSPWASPRRRALSLWACVTLATSGCGAPGEAPPTSSGGAASAVSASFLSLTGQGLGTTWNVTAHVPDGVRRDDVEAAVVAALQDVDEGMSTWRDDSDLARVRAQAGPVSVRPDTAEVVRAALALAEDTGGAFDPTVQPLMALWGFFKVPRTTWPTEEELAAARARVGFGRVRVGVDEAGRTTVDAGGTELDLSAIAKGHAVDRVAWALVGLGVDRYLVEVGGEVRVAGRSSSNAPWRVGIDDPRSPGGAPARVVQLTEGAVATSGNYRSKVVIEGRAVGHTMDPRTGAPAETRVLSATVVAPDCRTADGWATALMVMGEAGLPLVSARPGLEALLLVESEDGEVVERMTAGMLRRLVTP